MDQVASWRAVADLDARAGEPVGKALREAASTVERLRKELAEANWLVGNYMAAAQMAERDRNRAEQAEGERDRLKGVIRNRDHEIRELRALLPPDPDDDGYQTPGEDD